MARVTLTILDRNNKYLDLLASVMDTSRTQAINDILEHINREDLESDIWADWDVSYKTYLDFVEEVGSEESDLEEGEEEEK